MFNFFKKSDILNSKYDDNISIAYNDYENATIIKYGTFGSIMGIIFSILFALQDIYILNRPEFIYSRMFTLVPSLIFVLYRFLFINYSQKQVRFFHYFMLTGFMSTGAYLLSIESWSDFILRGAIVLVFYVFILYVGNIQGLILIYFIPFSIMIIYNIIYKNLPLKNFSQLADMLTGMICAAIFSQVISNLRYNEFRAKFFLEKKNKEYLEELEKAKRIQQRLIPVNNPDIYRINIYSIYKPMGQVGGDYFHYIEFPSTSKLGIFISDIEGHGVPAALQTGIIKSLIEKADQNIKDNPGELLSYLNENMLEMTGGTFFTALYGIIDTKEMVLTFARGGHCPPILFHHKQIHELESKGIFMGLEKSINYENVEIQIHSSDKIIFYTDGLMEERNEYDKEFQDVLIQKIFTELSNDHIEDLLEKTYNELINFKGNEKFEDDVCIIGIEIM